jgi:lysophospholipase L1-like esterase
MKKIFSNYFLIVGILLFILTLVKKIYYNNLNQYSSFYLISLIFIIIHFLLKKITKIKTYYTAILISIFFIFLVYAGNITIYFLKKKNYEDGIEAFYKIRNKFPNFNKESPVEFYLRENNKEFFPLITSSYFNNKNQYEFFPLSTINNKKIIFCNENKAGDYVFYKSDRYGFNNPDIIYETINNKKKIIVVGDSSAHGFCEDINYAELLRKYLQKDSKYEVINLGMGGAGPLETYARIKEYAEYFETKKIIWFISYNDLDDLSRESENRVLKKYLDNSSFSQELIKNQKKINEIYEDALKNFINDKKKNLFKDLDKINYLNFIAFNDLRMAFSNTIKNEFFILNDFKNILIKTNNYCVEKNCEITYLTLFPINPMDDKNFITKYKAMSNKIKKILIETNSNYIELDLFKKQNDFDAYLNDLKYHLNAKGHNILFEIIKDKVLNDIKQ